MTIIYQGEDIQIHLYIKEDGTAININDFDNIIMDLWQNRDTRARFALTPEDGEEPIEVIDASAGEVSIKLTRGITAGLSSGELKLEIKLVIGDETWPLNDRHSVNNGLVIAKVMPSQTKDIV